VTAVANDVYQLVHVLELADDAEVEAILVCWNELVQTKFPDLSVISWLLVQTSCSSVRAAGGRVVRRALLRMRRATVPRIKSRPVSGPSVSMGALADVRRFRLNAQCGMPSTPFFATGDDLRTLFQELDGKEEFLYTRAGHLRRKAAESYSTGCELPNLGRATAEQSVSCDRYLVMLRNTPVILRRIDAGQF
jgi:hypothetical protein